MSGPSSLSDYRGEQTLMTMRPTRLIAFRYWVLFVFSLLVAPTLWFVNPVERFGKVNLNALGWSLDHILTILFLILALYGFVRAELMRKTTRYIITDNKIIREDGILNKNTEMIPYTQLERVDLRQSFLQRALRIGTLVVDTGDDTLEIEMVSHPAKIQELLSQRLGRRAYFQQR
jgi:membrane protein YdbS with pleckstrin-like domain